MPAPTTSDEFLDLTHKSGVVDHERLDAYVTGLRGRGQLPAEPRKLALLMLREGLLTKFQAEQILSGKWKRFTIGTYRVLEKLGSGGMGQVYLCEHRETRRRVAIKVLPVARAADSRSSSLERFRREARVMSALDHVNLVRAYDIDRDGDLHFLVMEYVDGVSLQALVDRSGPLDPARACHYVYQAAQGLQHAADQAGIIHRDIKPENILVDRRGVVKILDMGLARFFDDEQDTLTQRYNDEVLGTADYLAPEQAVDSHDVDVRADIYSLGATFYFLLTGRPPFPEGTIAQKLLWHHTKEPTPVRELRPEVPAKIEAVVRRMMARDVSARYQRPVEVAEALAPFVAAPIAPPAESEMPRLCPATMASGPPTPAPRPTATPRPAPRAAATEPRAAPRPGSGDIHLRPTRTPQRLAAATPRRLLWFAALTIPAALAVGGIAAALLLNPAWRPW